MLRLDTPSAGEFTNGEAAEANSGGRSGEGRYDEATCAPREANVDIELHTNGQEHNLELLLVLQRLALNLLHLLPLLKHLEDELHEPGESLIVDDSPGIPDA